MQIRFLCLFCWWFYFVELFAAWKHSICSGHESVATRLGAVSSDSFVHIHRPRECASQWTRVRCDCNFDIAAACSNLCGSPIYISLLLRWIGGHVPEHRSLCSCSNRPRYIQLCLVERGLPNFSCFGSRQSNAFVHQFPFFNDRLAGRGCFVHSANDVNSHIHFWQCSDVPIFHFAGVGVCLLDQHQLWSCHCPWRRHLLCSGNAERSRKQCSKVLIFCCCCCFKKVSLLERCDFSYVPASIVQSFPVGVQTITLVNAPPVPAQTVGSVYNAAASSTSNLPVQISIDPVSSSVCRLDPGNNVTAIGTGTCVVIFNQVRESKKFSSFFSPQIRKIIFFSKFGSNRFLAANTRTAVFFVGTSSFCGSSFVSGTPGQAGVTQTTCNLLASNATYVCASCLPTAVVAPNTCTVSTVNGITTITTNQPQAYPSGFFSYPPNVRLVFNGDVTFSSFATVGFCLPNGTDYAVSSLMQSTAGRLSLNGGLALFVGPYYPSSLNVFAASVSPLTTSPTFGALYASQWPDNTTTPSACNSLVVSANYTGVSGSFVNGVNITLVATGAPGCPAGLTGGQIAGIVIGSVFGAALLAVGAYFLITKVFLDPRRELFSGVNRAASPE